MVLMAPLPITRDEAGSFPVTVSLRTIGVSFAWWREQALRLEEAGYAGVAAWDHFVSRGVRSDPVLEAWTTLAAVGAVTSRIGLMTFVAYYISWSKQQDKPRPKQPSAPAAAATRDTAAEAE